MYITLCAVQILSTVRTVPLPPWRLSLPTNGSRVRSQGLAPSLQAQQLQDNDRRKTAASRGFVERSNRHKGTINCSVVLPGITIDFVSGLLLWRGHAVLGLWRELLITIVLLSARWRLLREWPVSDAVWSFLRFHGLPNGGREISSNRVSWRGHLLGQSRPLALVRRIHRRWRSKWRCQTIHIQSLLEHDWKLREIRFVYFSLIHLDSIEPFFFIGTKLETFLSNRNIIECWI